MQDNLFFRRNPDAKEFFNQLLHEVDQRLRPANEIILNDQQVMRMLSLSRRKLDSIKANRIIPFSRQRKGTPSYFLLSDILKWLNDNRQESIVNSIKIK